VAKADMTSDVQGQKERRDWMNKKTNILVIVSDQLTWRALSCYGNTYVNTENIDRIADGGTCFDAAYTPCPLCQPARASFWTGIYPHETKVLSNGRNFPVQPVPDTIPTIGEVFAKAGYETVHFGKCHDAGALRGFYCEPQESLPVEGSAAWPVGYDTERDRYTTVKSVEYLKKNHEKPFFMIVDLQNPHDICNWVGHNKGVHEDIPTGEPLPPLPENFEFDDIENRPIAVQYICCSHNRQAQAAGWTPSNYQHYLAAYYHYVKRLDKEVGLILDALEERPDADNTLIVFFADHGDSMAARGRTTKQVDLYEEVTRVPFIFKGPGIRSGHIGDDIMPVSLLDLFPTLCSYAGIEAPPGLRGIDLMPLLTGKGEVEKREYVVSEWHTEWGFTISPGRMIRTKHFKYTKYIEDGAEELYDLVKDPYEKVNQAKNPEYKDVLEYHRYLLKEQLEKAEDAFFTMEWKADLRWRSHKVGYQNHVGPSAPMLEGGEFKPFDNKINL